MSPAGNICPDALFREALDSYRAEPPPAVWRAVERRLRGTGTAGHRLLVAHVSLYYTGMYLRPGKRIPGLQEEQASCMQSSVN